MTRGSGVPAHRLKQMKRSMRREMLARRDALPPDERAAKSLAIAERLLSLPEMQRARTVMVFSSFGSEVDTAPIIEHLADAGRRIVLPRIEAGEVLPVTYRPGDLVSETSFGVMEPSAGEVVDPRELDAILTPGVAFDRPGNRTGYGGGYYDRLFRLVRDDAPKIAVAFAIQVLDEVPSGRGDRRVDLIVTEDDVIRCSGA